MPPKRSSKSEKDRGGGKRARVSGDGGWEQAKDVQVSEGITERQLASFSQVSAEANTSRILQAQQDLASNSHAGLNSLLAAAGAQAAPSAAAPNVLGEYNAAIQLFQLQQGANVAHAFPAGFTPHARGGGPPAGGIPMPIGNVHDISTIGLGQSASFGQNTLQSLLTAQMAVQSSAPSMLQLPQYALQPGVGALPSMVSLKSQGPGKSSLNSPGQNTVTPFTARPGHTMAKAGCVERAYEHKHSNGSVCSVGSSSGAARADGSTSSTTRSHGPSADRYKNRWSEEEITALKKGVARFEKKNKKRAEEGSSSKGRLEAVKKGDTEQMWDHILASHKFQACRNARDLKDKWRQLKKKEQDDLLGVREEARRLRMLAVGPGGSSNEGNSSGSQGHANSGDNESSTSSSNGKDSTDQAGKNPSQDSPAGSSSPTAGMSSCSGSASSPAPTAQATERSGQSVRASKAAASHGDEHESEHGSDNSSEADGAGAVGSESGGAEGGSEGSEGGGDERHGAGGSEQGEGSEGGRRQGSEGSGDTGGDSIGLGTDETGQTSNGHSSNSATSSHEGRSDSSHEGGSEGRGGEEGASDGSSEWREDDDNGSEDKDRKEKQVSSSERASKKRSRLPRAAMLQRLGAGDDTSEGSQSWALAIDLGAASVRVVIVNKDGATLHDVEGHRNVNMDPAAGTFSATDYMACACQAVDDALSSMHKFLKPPVNLRVVGISCFALSLVGVGDDGEAVTPVHTHADARNQAHAGELKRKLSQEGSLDILERRTAPVQACFAPALLHRLRQSSDWGNGKVKRWCSLSCYILGKITGQPQPMTFSEASSTGLLDRQDFQWHAGLLSRLGLEPAALPALCDTHEVYKGSIVAEYRKRWPELAGIAWARGVGEPAAFHVGVGCAGQARQQGRPRVCVHLGNTAASIRVCTPSKDAPQQHAPGDVNDKAGLRAGAVSASLCHFVVQRDVVLVGSTLADGGSIYAWGTQQLAGGLEEMARLQAEASEMATDSHGLTVLPFFSGGNGSFAGGGGDQLPTGTLTGMTLRTSRAGILRAILEAVALQLKGVFASIAPILPENSFEVFASGDALLKSPLWQQILADAFGVRIHVLSGEKQAAAKGAAILALRAMGEAASLQQRPESVVVPTSSGIGAMDKAFRRQEALHHRMNRH